MISNVELQIAIPMNSVDAICRMVQVGFGIAVIPAGIGGLYEDTLHIKVIRLTDAGPGATWSLSGRAITNCPRRPGRYMNVSAIPAKRSGAVPDGTFTSREALAPRGFMMQIHPYGEAACPGPDG